MSKRRNKDGNYIDDFIEWQDNQYNPGFYTGGKIPPFYKKLAKSRIVGWLYIIASLLFVIMLLSLFISGVSSNGLFSAIVAFIMFGGVGILYFFFGRRYLKVWVSRKRKK